MIKNSSELKVAFVTESLWSMAGANRVLAVFAKIYPHADIYALFGEPKNLTKELRRHKIVFSSLNSRWGIEKTYRYTYHLWPNNIEKFDFSNYDLVISSSASVSMGVVTPVKCLHVAYIHSPMRYLWDLGTLSVSKFRGMKRTIVDFLLLFIRLWEVTASNRPDILIANSRFVADRIQKYWRRKVDAVVTPPIHFYKGKIYKNRKQYIVAGAPFEFNKRGDFLLECISDTNINIKLIGYGSQRASLKRKYRKFKNIEFLDNITDSEKYELFAHAKCFVMPGIEDYGIFPVEAMSAGCPVLAYKGGGILENIEEGVNGYFFDKWEKDIFLKQLKRVLKRNWDYERISKSVKKNNTEEMFKKRIEDIITF